MAHKVIDTITKKGKRRQVKSRGHNKMRITKILESREKAINKVK